MKLLVLVLYLFFFLPIFHWDVKVQALGALLIIQILWIGRVFPLAYSSLLFILMLSFHFFSYEETLQYLSSEIVWLLFSTFIISHAFIETGLASRLSLQLLKISRGSGRALVLISFILMLILAILIPSNIGKGNLVSSVLDRLLKSLKQIDPVKNLGAALFIGISYSAGISGAFVATGASSTIYTFGLFTDITDGLSYLSWLYYFVPPILLYIVLVWIVFLYTFPPENINRQHLLEFINERLGELGRLSRKEKKVMIIMGLTLVLWATQVLHGYSIPLVGLLGAALTVLPGIGVWNWDEAKKSINWDMMLFFASTLMVSGMLIKTGTINWLADMLIHSLASQSGIVVLLALVLCTALIRLIFVNILGFLTIMIPLAINIGENLAGFSPLVVAMAVFLAGIPGFFLITQSPVHLISYSYGYFTDRELMRAGLPSSLLWLIVIAISALFYWPLL
ncbi:DASS family sodium-coupled anion symporter [Halobacillus salinarum]|uniref:Sodium-dependent dicarboxylate transporter SdcS n=1 Tax=Halobacillus salinarum TaxID=2932257 RepID=A0ABY4EN22_9BACI|nr:DASS family sodium-coupled anion symporter [Halobacillus salinarum]UOQ45538.1 DASS family sodium-coupled anion symporter [Halobacillus salinarum]